MMTRARRDRVEIEKMKVLLGKIEAYYRDKLERYGTTPAGVDWNSRESQELRFSQLLHVCTNTSDFSINELGCGYGGLVQYLRRRRKNFTYCGVDLSEVMIHRATGRFGSVPGVRFKIAAYLDAAADYTVASGVFNVKSDSRVGEWESYVGLILENMNAVSRRGFAFNCLTKYSDAGRMRKDLYYADPCELFDYCKRRFSKNVALLHDYGLYEFTIIVRKVL